jgi:hypothetical protein
MNLELRRVYLYSLIKESLKIESLEYCYFIPILAQTAEYWGDANLVHTCNMMSRQVQQYFTKTAHIHFCISKQNKHFTEKFFFTCDFANIKKSITLEQSLANLQCCEATLSNFDLSYSIGQTANLQKTIPFSVDIYEFEEKHLSTISEQLEEKNWELLEQISDVLDQKKILDNISERLLINHLSDLNQNNYDPLLKNLACWKNWKAHTWYPLLATIAHQTKMVTFANFFSQLSKSEKKISKVISELQQPQYY